jgi:hypothetical protein
MYARAKMSGKACPAYPEVMQVASSFVPCTWYLSECHYHLSGDTP